MDEQKETTGQATETTTPAGSSETTEGQNARKTQREERIDKSLSDIKAEREKLEKANSEKRELQAVDRELKAQRDLGGDSEAGGQAPKPKEETDKEYKDRVMSGEL